MEYETKHWIVRWTSFFDHRLHNPTSMARTYGRIYDNQFQAWKHYRKLVKKDIISVYLVREDIKGNEYILDSMKKAVPVGYSEV